MPVQVLLLAALLRVPPLRVSDSALKVTPPDRARVAPEDTVVPAPVPPRAAALEICRVPAETVVVPV